jgi:hypothetical protein
MYKAPFNTKFKFELWNFGLWTCMMLNDDIYVKQWKEELKAYLNKFLYVNEEFCYPSAKTAVLQHRNAEIRLCQLFTAS